jgi:hypothetical protein
MMNECFNPNCRKPLHYLREGRVFVFGVKADSEGQDGEGSHLEHYWLCGACAQFYGLAQDGDGVRLVKRNRVQRSADLELPGPEALAS